MLLKLAERSAPNTRTTRTTASDALRPANVAPKLVAAWLNKPQTLTEGEIDEKSCYRFRIGCLRSRQYPKSVATIGRKVINIKEIYHD